jgi:membrane protease YdiL (CAAX protease family)
MPGHPLVETSDPKPTKIGILLRVALFILIGYMGMLLFSWMMLPLAGLVVTAALAPFASAAIANAIVVRVYERGRLADLGLAWTATSLREFLLGGGLAAGAATLILVIPLAAGIARFESAPVVEHRWTSIFFIAIVLLFGAAGEEMLFHGYAFQLLIRSMGAFATILPAAVLFGLAHLGNENANLMGVLNTMLWGVLLGYAYMRTRALWLPIGLHYGWNLALPLFGVNLSGFTIGITGYALHWRVGDLWSGGGYGPEGGLPATVVVIVLFFAVARVFPDLNTDVGPHASRQIGDPDAVE